MATSRLLHRLRLLRAHLACRVHGGMLHSNHTRGRQVDESVDAKASRTDPCSRLGRRSDVADEGENGQVSHDDYSRLRHLLDAVHGADAD